MTTPSAVDAAIDWLERYATIIRACRSDEIERFGYLPELEDVIARLREVSAKRGK